MLRAKQNLLTPGHLRYHFWFTLVYECPPWDSTARARMTAHQCLFSCPRLEGPPGAASNWIVRLFVCPSVRNSILLSNKEQYFKFGWWYSNQTWTVSPSMDCSHFTDIPCPWEWGWGQNEGLKRFLPYFNFVATGVISVFLKHMSSFFLQCDCATVYTALVGLYQVVQLLSL